MSPVAIERIGSAAAANDVRGLALLLVDAVDGIAGVSFLAGLTADEAEAWRARGTTRNGCLHRPFECVSAKSPASR
jgi:hypothetical protein